MGMHVQRENHPIMDGTNDLTAKMLCSVDNNFNLTRYNSIKIVGDGKWGEVPGCSELVCARKYAN